MLDWVLKTPLLFVQLNIIKMNLSEANYLLIVTTKNMKLYSPN